MIVFFLALYILVRLFLWGEQGGRIWVYESDLLSYPLRELNPIGYLKGDLLRKESPLDNILLWAKISY